MAFNVISNQGKKDKHEGQFKSAIAYLKQSDLAAFIIGEIEADPRTIKVEISEDPKWKNAFRHADATVKWNPTYGLETTFTPRGRAQDLHGRDTEDLSGILSASMLLLHEIGHAYQWMGDKAGYEGQIAAMQEQLRSGRNLPKKGFFTSKKTHHKQKLQAMKDRGWMILEETNVAALENTVAMELREKGCDEGIRWWYADNVGKPTFSK